MANAPSTLHDLGLQVLQHFRQIQSIASGDGKGSTNELSRSTVAAEAERFELWSINLGVFVSGHGSLDYRLRQADGLRQTIFNFLTGLFNALREARAYWSIETPAVDENSLGEPSDEDLDPTGFVVDDFHELGSDVDLLLDSIRDPIDRLYKVSTWIRKPSSRFASSKALLHQELDPESNVDLLQVAAKFDHDFISSAFLEYRKTKALAESPDPYPFNPKESEDGCDAIWEPMRSVLEQYALDVSQGKESFLVSRLARANVRRRQQFAYWRKHRKKLIQHSAPATRQTELTDQPKSFPDFPGSRTRDRLETYVAQMPVPSVTTATHLEVSQLKPRDDESRISVSEYAPSTYQHSQEIVDFPSPPTHSSSSKFFECPYCFTLCPKAVLTPRAWK